MSACPGYLGITINNRIDQEELFKYDALVSCPCEFNITFKIPNWGQKQDKTFDLHLEDSRKSYDIYLSHLMLERKGHQLGRHSGQQKDDGRAYMTFMSIAVLLVVACVIVCVLAYLFLDVTRIKVVHTTHNGAAASLCNSPSKPEQPLCSSGTSLTQGQFAFVLTYVIYRLLYSILFTFSIVIAFFLILVHTDFLQLDNIPQFQLQNHNKTQEVFLKMNQYSSKELLRQGKLVTSMQGACSNYIEELLSTSNKEMANITKGNFRENEYRGEASISFIAYDWLSRNVKHYRYKVDVFNNEYQALLNNSVRTRLRLFRQYLDRVYDQDYLVYPQKLSNKSYSISKQETTDVGVTPNGLSAEDTAVTFAAYLQVAHTDQVLGWLEKTWDRYSF